jgi:hypothetical protein
MPPTLRSNQRTRAVCQVQRSRGSSAEWKEWIERVPAWTGFVHGICDFVFEVRCSQEMCWLLGLFLLARGGAGGACEVPLVRRARGPVRTVVGESRGQLEHRHKVLNINLPHRPSSARGSFMALGAGILARVPAPGSRRARRKSPRKSPRKTLIKSRVSSRPSFLLRTIRWRTWRCHLAFRT